MVESCPSCGGRVSASLSEAGKLSAVCTGTAGEERACGWTADESSSRVVPMKRTA